MGRDFHVSRRVAGICVAAALIAVATIIALSVVYDREKSKSTQSEAHGPTNPFILTEPWQRFRLPDTLAPISYNVTLRPQLVPGADGRYIFNGTSSVIFECMKETDLIIIHCNKLDLSLLQLSGLEGAVPPGMKSYHLEKNYQYLVFQLNGKMQVGSTYKLLTQFTGELSDDLGGFYRSEYIEDGVKRVVATTQMQPAYARKAFPCFDEPAMKAVFYLTLIHPQDTIALSNSKISESYNLTIDREKLTQTKFEPTQKMSTYLLAFVVSDFSHIEEVSDAGVLIRIWARKKAIEQHQGDYALNKTGRILAFFQKYYNSTYPLTKSDQIALPDFNAGAMENWGLITYRETALLYRPDLSSTADKEWVVTVIAHELAHMWFGNLVTTRWWNDLWLNEGFATYVSYLGADYAEPTWNLKDTIVLDEVISVMAVDALASSHPLSSKEEDTQKPEQIIELFNSITYKKGASVLRMLSEFVTEDVFTKGLHTYLEEFKYRNAVYGDLWRHLQMAVDQADIKLPHSVDSIMNRWILQMGFPLVTINTQTGEISQKHFLLDPESVVDRPSEFNYEWFVPITWMKGNGATGQFWLLNKDDTNKDMALSPDDWLVANLNMTGFYRVNYDSQNWKRLLQLLNSQHKHIPVINRAQLIDDAFNLARAKAVETTLALRTTMYLKKEVEYLPWQTASNNLDYFYLMFDRSEVFAPMQAYLKKQVTPLYEYYKNLTADWIKIPEGHTDQYNQVNAISLACSTGVPGCTELTTGWFTQWMKNPAFNISPNLRYRVYCSGIAAGGEEEWNFVWEKYKSAPTASEAGKLMHALACTNQRLLLSKYLDYCLDPTMIRKQDAASVIVHIAGNTVGQPLAWDFIRTNWEEILTNYGGGSAWLINGVTKRFSSQLELDQLRRFKQDHKNKFGTATMALEQALERTKANLKWVEQNKKAVLDWFTNEA